MQVKMLKKTCSEVYLTVPENAAVVTHVFLLKLKLADWSTENAGSEVPSKICVGVSTPRSKKQRDRTAVELHNVEMDGVLNQPNTQRNVI